MQKIPQQENKFFLMVAVILLVIGLIFIQYPQILQVCTHIKDVSLSWIW